jgi:aspartate carbamoyltransferase catalytic subunit
MSKVNRQTSPRHLVSSSDINKAGYDEIFRRSMKFINEGIPPDLMPGKVVATLFFQPSTRTMNAFQVAFLRAGGGWVGVMGEKGLSMEKGESFDDTIREYSSFADVIALRHPDDDSSERAAKVSRVPVINCGGGSKEHAVAPAMMLAVLGMYLKRPLQGAKIGIYGTPEINRATKAMVPILGMFGVELVIDDLGHFPLPKDVETKAKKNGLNSLSYGKLDDFIGDVDILFITRGLQKGIIPADKFPKEKEGMILKLYKPITKEHVKKMRKDALLYMIKPRIFEIETDVDDDPRAIYSKHEPYTEACLAVVTYLLGVQV